MPKPATSIGTKLYRAQDVFDRIVAEANDANGPRDQRHFDELEARASSFCESVMNAFRRRS